ERPVHQRVVVRGGPGGAVDEVGHAHGSAPKWNSSRSSGRAGAGAAAGPSGMSISGTDGSLAIRSAMALKHPIRSSMDERSKRSVLYSMPPLIRDPFWVTVRLRSTLVVLEWTKGKSPRCITSPSAPGFADSISAAFWKLNTTWYRGGYPATRSTLSWS